MESDWAAVGGAGALENIRAHVVAVECSTGQSFAEEEDALGAVWSTGQAEEEGLEDWWSTGHDISVEEQLGLCNASSANVLPAIGFPGRYCCRCYPAFRNLIYWGVLQQSRHIFSLLAICLPHLKCSRLL